MKYDWSKEKLESTVADANCWYVWLDILGVPRRGCNYRTLQRKAKAYEIDTSHFNYEYARTHNGLRRVRNRSNEDIFCFGSVIKRENLKREYVSRILNGKYACECCGISEWQGQPIVLQIHHIDGNSKNNSSSNLKLLCPNCHSQTNNYANKKR